MKTNVIINSDCIEGLKQIPDKSIHCCVTSPPYYGLRDYGHDSQIGLEETPEAYVAKLVEVFREVKRVLRDDGTLWLNLGDSYAAQRGGTHQPAESLSGGISGKTIQGDNVNRDRFDGYNPTRNAHKIGLKHKDLIGIPWAVAKALRDTYYLGKIKNDTDKAWMAAIIDGEGTICGFDHLRKDDGRIRTGINICVINTNLKLLDRCFEIYPVSRYEHNAHGEGHFGSLPCYRWIVHGNENKIQFIKEIYPFLVAKKKQALLAYNLLLFQTDAKKLGKTPMKDAVNSKRQLLVSLISELNNARDVDVPGWCVDVDVDSLWEQGWYLRQDIIWHKPNPMPESVTDRCTKSHEYIFLLSKSQKYYYDQEAVKEKAVWDLSGDETGLRVDRQNLNNKSMPTKLKNGIRPRQFGTTKQDGTNHNDVGNMFVDNGTRNKRSVWTVTTKPFSGAHFATFPEDLIAPCIKAGCPEDGIVLDPFGGAGTTAVVARKLNRNYLLFELNPDYIKIAENRIYDKIGLFL